MTIRRTLASILTFCWEFVQKHRYASIVLGLLTMAACAGGIYLIVLKFPAYWRSPCFRGSCGNPLLP